MSDKRNSRLTFYRVPYPCTTSSEWNSSNFRYLKLINHRQLVQISIFKYRNTPINILLYNKGLKKYFR